MIIAALLPVVVTLMLGFFAGWHHDFDNKQASLLNRMVMLYALPLALFVGIIATPRDKVLLQLPLAAAIVAGMVGGYVLVFAICLSIFKRSSKVAAVEALAIAGPAVPFVGLPILGQLFGATNPISVSVAVSVASLVMNLFQVPLTIMVLVRKDTEAGAAQTGGQTIGRQLVEAMREPVVWLPLIAFVLVVFDVHFPDVISKSLRLLGNSTGGVALFASGVVIYSHRVALNLPVGVAVVARNIVIPAILWGVMALGGFAPAITREAVITLSIPTASIPTILAVQYNVCEQEMASILFFSSILSVLTMGGFIFLLF
jgi:predicted permease